jgi:hypothetical protein
MPLWLGLISSFLSGVFGTLVGTPLRIRHERDSSLRPFMIESAQKFAGIASTALRDGRDAIDHRFAYEPDPDNDGERVEWHEWFEAATVGLIEKTDEDLHEAVSRLLTLRLFFGEDSNCSAHAKNVVELIAGAVSVAKEVPADPAFLADVLLNDAEVELADFHRDACHQIRRPEMNPVVAMRRRRRYAEAVREGRENWKAANIPGYKSKAGPTR